MGEPAIVVEDLHFSYGRKSVLEGVDLEVPAGSIFGFLGRNGAGKTTTIQVLLGLLRPKSGTCKVVGLDPQKDPLAVRKVVGYLAEEQRMYGWMTVAEICTWTGSFYPTWDAGRVAGLLDRFGLSSKAKVKTLSKGQNTCLGLVLGHGPKVVILDDPTLGLDPIARKEFLRSIIDLLQSDGVTVFFSSHLLYEMEPVADRVAILDRGRIVRTGPTDDLRDRTRRLVLVPQTQVDWSHMAGVLDVTVSGGATCVTLEAYDEDRRKAMEQLGQGEAQETALNLDEIFEAYVIGNRGRGVVCGNR